MGIDGKENILVVSRTDKVSYGIQGVFVFMFCFLIDPNIYSRVWQDLLRSDAELLSLAFGKMSIGETVGGMEGKKFPPKCSFHCTSSLQGTCV